MYGDIEIKTLNKRLIHLYGFAENLEAVLDRSEGLVAGFGSGSTKDQLRVELPVGREVPGALYLLVDQGAVVL